MTTKAGPVEEGVAAYIASVELEDHEVPLAAEAQRVARRLDQLEAVLAAEGLTQQTPRGATAHWALVESRQQGALLHRLMSSIQVQDSGDALTTSQRARRAAIRRWHPGVATG
jgi:hypothetical protein